MEDEVATVRKGSLMEESRVDSVDYDVRRFAEMLTELPAWTPVASWFEESDPQEKGRWWSSQREHMIFFFMDRLYPQPHYRGGKKPRPVNLSALEAYKELKNPEGLVWIHEALRTMPHDELKALCASALQIERKYRKRETFLRKHLSWDNIVVRAGHRPELEGKAQPTSVLKERSEKINESTLLLG